MKPKVGIISAGALGTALAQSISKNNDNILLWGRNPELINEINNEHTNSKYYPNFQLNENITGINDLEKLHDYMEENGCQSATEVLHLRGWVRIKYNTAYLPRIEILGSCIDLTKPRKNTIDPAMNERQMRVAKELCEKCNTELHVAINDKRFW